MNNSTAVKVANKTVGDPDAHAHTSKQSCMYSCHHYILKTCEKCRCFLGVSEYLSVAGGHIPGFGLVAFDWQVQSLNWEFFFLSVSTYLAAREWNPEGYLGMFQKLIGSYILLWDWEFPIHSTKLWVVFFLHLSHETNCNKKMVVWVT